MVSVLIADPVAVFRAGVRNALASAGGFALDEAASFDGVARAVRARSPEVALVDLALPSTGAVAAVELIGSLSPLTRTIVWSLSDDAEAAFSAISAGAYGFLPKQISPQGLVRALRGVVQGEAPLTRALAATIVAHLHHSGLVERHRRKAALLTAREREVLELVVAGARNSDIAAELAISAFTAKRHVQNILDKLELPSRRAAAAFYAAAFADSQVMA